MSRVDEVTPAIGVHGIDVEVIKRCSRCTRIAERVPRCADGDVVLGAPAEKDLGCLDIDFKEQVVPDRAICRSADGAPVWRS